MLGILLVGPVVWCAGIAVGHVKGRRARGRAPRELVDSPAKGAPPAEAEQREKLKSAEYMVVLIGYAIGIGNVWRFPYLVGKYGGGAFVFAYVVCLFLAAIPLFFMELIMGQFTRRAPVQCFGMIRPRWASLGYAQCGMACATLCYYNILIAYAGVYIISSLVTPLPWAEPPALNGTAAQNASSMNRTESAALRFW